MARRMNLRSPILNAFAGAIFLIIVAVVSFFAGRFTSPASAPTDSRQQAPTIQAEQKINKDFNFSVKDQSGHEITKITYQLTTADLQNQIIIQGQRATAVKGKMFLIINFALTNSSNKYIQLTSRDYIRLKGSNGELIAPDIHNDPIQIQPISTKESRLGFAVNDTQKNFTFSIGEIDGKKTDVEVSF